MIFRSIFSVQECHTRASKWALYKLNLTSGISEAFDRLRGQVWISLAICLTLALKLTPQHLNTLKTVNRPHVTLYSEASVLFELSALTLMINFTTTKSTTFIFSSHQLVKSHWMYISQEYPPSFNFYSFPPSNQSIVAYKVPATQTRIFSSRIVQHWIYQVSKIVVASQGDVLGWIFYRRFSTPSIRKKNYSTLDSDNTKCSLYVNSYK